MKQYELTYLISPELKIEESRELASEINALLNNEGGSVVKMEGPEPKNLSYRIKKQGAAFQVNLEFCFVPEKLKTFEEKLKKDSRILRYLIVVKKPPERKREKKEPKTDIIKEEKPSFDTTSIETSAFGSTESAFGQTKSADKKVSERKTEKKVELKDIEEKLEEILKE